MSKDLKTIDLNILPLETLAEMANEAAEQFEENAKRTVQKALDAGRYLIAAKEQLEHGQWGAWLGKNWNYTPRTASNYMLLASKSETISDLLQAKHYNAAMRMIAEEKAESEPETAPRSERKIGQVEVVEPAESKPTGVQADDSVIRNSRITEPDNDPAPDPPTIRKTAKGSEKVPEGKKPKTAAIVPEILKDEPEVDPWEYMTFGDIVAVAVSKLADETQQKKAAKELRKLADKLDPPTKFVKPTVEDVTAYCLERKNSVDPETFIAHYNANGWKLSNGNKCADWKAAVITWEKRDKSEGKGNRNGSGNQSSAGLGSNSRPPVPRAKINYK